MPAKKAMKADRQAEVNRRLRNWLRRIGKRIGWECQGCGEVHPKRTRPDHCAKCTGSAWREIREKKPL